MQFWLSNLPSDTALATLVRTAKLRWRIEHDYREMKQALGLAHFEGRTWRGWHHHVTLVSVAHAFCTSSASPGPALYGLNADNAVHVVAQPDHALPFGHPNLPTLLGSQLIRRLSSLRVVGLDELTQELATLAA